jgi:DNA repair protein RecO (recombination protein O)
VARIDSEALVARSVAYRDSDVIVTFLTESSGKVSAIVRGGRKSTKRVGGALEPFHTVRVSIDDKGGDLGALREAEVLKARQVLVASLEALEAAGSALRWARHLMPARTHEPAAYRALVELLDALDAGASPRLELARAAIRLLGAVGYGLEFDRCVACGRPCPEDKPAYMDAGRGGLVCRSCGGARRRLAAGLRAAGSALARGERPPLEPAQAEALLALMGDAMAAHAGIE